MLLLFAGDRGGGHQPGLLGGLYLPNFLGGMLPDRSPAQLRSCPDPYSVILAEFWDPCSDLPVVRPAASGKKQQG